MDFDKNVLKENQGIALCTAPTKEVIMKPHQQSAILTTNKSGIVYKAITPGMTNATIVFNYQVKIASGMSTAKDNTTRTYAFDIHKTVSTGVSASNSATYSHIKGIKVLHVHTIQSKVYVGSTFSLRGTVINNSTSTVTFENGTCTSPLSVTFNKNVLIEHHPLNASCKAQLVTLKRGEHSPIVSPKSSDISYRAIAPGMTNATILFKYRPLTPFSKSPSSDNITRTYSFKIQPAKTIATATAIASPIKIKP